jgi:Fic family protein
LLYLSDYIEARKSDYYDLLQRVRTRGDWVSWIRFFLDGVYQTARQAVAQSAALSDVREAYRHTAARKPHGLALVEYLFYNPYMTTARATRILDVTPPTARSAIAYLEAQGILTNISGQAYRRVYVCHPILSIIEGWDPSEQPTR